MTVGERTEPAPVTVRSPPARPAAIAFTSLAAAAIAMVIWALFSAASELLPTWVRLAAGLVLVFGPGAAAVSAVADGLPTLHRVALAFGFGLGFAPVLAHGLAVVGLLPLYPYISCALAGAGVACWSPRVAATPRVNRRTLIASLSVVALALLIGGIAYAHRVTRTGGAIAINGEYDAYDLTYYAAIAAEASHTLPPASPFYSGRLLNHSFYPHVILAVMHRFAAVPIVDLYFVYAWPLFLAIAALLCFLLVEEIASTAAAVCASALLILGSDLSFLVAWVWKPSGWDDVIWAANFLSSGAEVLLFNNWTPAVALVFAGLYGVARCEQTSPRRWIVLAAASFAITVLFKPFAFALVLLGIGGSWIGARGPDNRAARLRLLQIGAATILLAIPFLARIALLYDDAQVIFTPAIFTLPLRMLDRLELESGPMFVAAALGATGWWQVAILGLLGTPLFLVGSLGFRLAGLPGVWRALRHPSRERPIVRVLAWAIVGAVAIPFGIMSVPYHETIQIHQFALFLLPIFVARAVMRTSRVTLLTVFIFALATPSMLHFLHLKWTDDERPYLSITASEQSIVQALRRADPARTLVLHSRPSEGTLIGILAGRRSVLSWSRYVRGSEERRGEVDRFFRSDGRPPGEALAVLDRYQPTHVIEDRVRDRLHPDIRTRLRAIVRTQTRVLYEVLPRPEANAGYSGRSALPSVLGFGWFEIQTLRKIAPGRDPSSTRYSALFAPR